MSLPYSPLLRNVFGFRFSRVGTGALEAVRFFAAAPEPAAGGAADVAGPELDAPSGRAGIDDAARRRITAVLLTALGAALLPPGLGASSETRSPRVLSSQARGCADAFAGFGFRETPPDGRFATTGAP